MKQVRKIFSILIVCMIVLSMTTAAIAAETNGSITIENPAEGQTYDIYLMFEMESFDKASGAYAYQITDDWRAFVESGAGKAYFSINDQGYVTEKADSPKDYPALAKSALEYAKSNSLTPEATLPAGGSYQATGLTLGYYLIDSSLGALCGLTTTNPDIKVREKNDEPMVEKEVKEGETWGSENDASIGDTVEFKTTIAAKPGARGYILHDQMTQGLTLERDSIVVEGAQANTDYDVSFDTQDGCTFEITFRQSYLEKIKEDTNIVVTYSAILNEQAEISTGANLNKTKLSYGDESKSETQWDDTKTYTFRFDLVKTKADNALLSGAEFRLYDAETGGNEIKLMEESKGVYRVATGEEQSAEGFVSATIQAGKVTIQGLDTGVYYLEETLAPAGYNKLPARVKVEIQGANLDAVLENDVWVNGGVHVVNQTGAELPSTGGMGTTAFYVLGSMLALSAAVLLITRRRMRNMNG